MHSQTQAHPKLSPGSAHVELYQHVWESVDCDAKNQIIRQTNKQIKVQLKCQGWTDNN